MVNYSNTWCKNVQHLQNLLHMFGLISETKSHVQRCHSGIGVIQKRMQYVAYHRAIQPKVQGLRWIELYRNAFHSPDPIVWRSCMTRHEEVGPSDSPAFGILIRLPIGIDPRTETVEENVPNAESQPVNSKQPENDHSKLVDLVL